MKSPMDNTIKTKIVFLMAIIILFVGFTSSVLTLYMGKEIGFLDYKELPDLNFLSNEHLALAGNQGLILDSIGNANLCGNGQFVPDSNRLNEVPRGTVYSCFIKEVR